MSTSVVYQSVPEIPQGEYRGFKDTWMDLGWRSGSLLRIRGSKLKTKDELGAGVIMSVALDDRMKWSPISETDIRKLCRSRSLNETQVFETIDTFVRVNFLREIHVQSSRYFIVSPKLIDLVMAAEEKDISYHP